MKKALILGLAFVLAFGMVACSDDGSGGILGSSSTAFEVSKEAYNNINLAYEKVNQFSQDVYTAWNMGIRDKDKFSGQEDGYYSWEDDYNDSEALTYFANELHISKSDLEAAVAKLMGKDSYDAGSEYSAGDWYTLSNVRYSSFFSACVDVVSTAYELNGISGEIKNLLNSARDQMKQLSDNYSDYEHYPNLKEYFTNTTAFFGFCMDPEGSFEQVVDTFNTYRNNARNYYYDLNYVFEDSLFPVDGENADETAAAETTIVR